MNFFSPEDAENTLGNSRRRMLPGRDFTRSWVRFGGRIIRLIWWTDYSRDFENGGVTYVKRSTNCQLPRGYHHARGCYSEKYAGWFAELPADQWCELVAPEPREALLLPGPVESEVAA